MFGGIGIASMVKIGILGAVMAAAGAFYLHYKNIVNERDYALQQVGALEAVKAIQDTTIDALVENAADHIKAAEKFQETLNKMVENQEKSNKHARKLNDVLSKHNLTALSKSKPGLIERRINSGSSNVLRMFESETAGRDQSNTGRSGKASGKTFGP